MVSPATTPTVNGRNSGTHTTSAVNATNRPFAVMSLRKAGPRLLPPVIRTATAIRIGMAARAASIAQVRSRRAVTRAGAMTPGAASLPDTASPPAAASLLDIEALSGQLDEALLQA